jgi:acyl carrier protein
MTKEDVFATLRDVAVEVLGVDADAVVEGASFKDDLDADSLDLVELVMALEEKLDITVPEEDLEDIGTVGDALKLLLDKLAAKA